MTYPKRRVLAPEVRRAAARMVIAANKANGEASDPRIVAIAEGKLSSTTSSKTDTNEAPLPQETAKPAEPEVAPTAGEEPAPAVAPPPPPPAPRTYTVVSGDTLWAISERFYGDGSKYQVIADASGIANPDLINPGQVLTIP